MEVDARGLIVEPEESQDPPRLALDILDEILVANTKDAARGRGIHCLHHPNIIAIETRDLALIVGRDVTFCEHHFEVRPATVERVPPKIDDPRFRKHQPDEADTEPIVVQLVDESRLV